MADSKSSASPILITEVIPLVNSVNTGNKSEPTILALVVSLPKNI